MIPPPPSSTLFPYTTLFRSHPRPHPGQAGDRCLSTQYRSPSRGSGRHPCVNRSAQREASARSEEHTSELQSLTNLVCRLLLEKKKVERSAHPDHKPIHDTLI